MPNERVERHTNRPLDDGEEAADRHDWDAAAKYTCTALPADLANKGTLVTKLQEEVLNRTGAGDVAAHRAHPGASGDPYGVIVARTGRMPSHLAGAL